MDEMLERQGGMQSMKSKYGTGLIEVTEHLHPMILHHRFVSPSAVMSTTLGILDLRIILWSMSVVKKMKAAKMTAVLIRLGASGQ